jgi:hypothetical protein
MRRALRPLELLLALVALVGGCASPDDGALRYGPAARGIERRAWSIGDEWSYRWKSPAGSGTLVRTVLRFETVEGVDSVVLQSGRREIFYRRTDGAHVLDKVDGGVELRNVLPVALIDFPIRAGRPWVLDYRRERPEARQSEDILMDCRAERPAPVTVPAGTFSASHVTCAHRRTSATAFEMWYAPEVGNNVKERAPLSSGGSLVRELAGYRLAPGGGPRRD